MVNKRTNDVCTNTNQDINISELTHSVNKGKLNYSKHAHKVISITNWELCLYCHALKYNIRGVLKLESKVEMVESKTAAGSRRTKGAV